VILSTLGKGYHLNLTKQIPRQGFGPNPRASPHGSVHLPAIARSIVEDVVGGADPSRSRVTRPAFNTGRPL